MYVNLEPLPRQSSQNVFYFLVKYEVMPPRRLRASRRQSKTCVPHHLLCVLNVGSKFGQSILGSKFAKQFWGANFP